MKTRILIIGLLLIASAALATGAFAYFTANANTGLGTVTTGTMGLQIASNASDVDVPTDFADTATPPWDMTSTLIAPGDTIFGCLWVKNTGNIDVIAVTWDFDNLVTTGGVGSIDLASRLQIIDLYTSDTGTLYDWPAALLPGGVYYSGGYYDRDSNGMITLNELAVWSTLNPTDPYDWMNDNPDAPFLLTLGTGQNGYVCMELQMINGLPEVDNNYQGATFQYDIEITGFNPSPY